MTSEALVMSIRESFGRVVYTHKTHEKQIELLTRNLSVAKWLEAILIAFTAGGAISVLFGTGYGFQLVTAILASIATAVTIYQLSFDPDHLIRDHRKCAKKLWGIRERYIYLLSDIADGAINEDVARLRRDELLGAIQEIYVDSPDTNAEAYSIAKTALKIHEEMTFSDEEIDSFLPNPLKRSGRQ